MSPDQSLLKKILDRLLACIALIVLSPLLILLSFIILYKLGSPIFFRQERPGLNGEPFTIYKFRTMSKSTDLDGKLLSDKDRMTPLGTLLRKYSLDELPEFFNVLIGDMSLVGPRPLLMQYLAYYTHRESIRNTVKPGITGWAQIHGRNHVSWDERLEMDVWYVENWSFWLDLRILCKTISCVLRRDGVAVVSYELEDDLDNERRQGAH